jgi:2-polyprenyl-3-methyl-5-hydroxy-6-metoxy-1,4-benzoquinol methylase
MADESIDTDALASFALKVWTIRQGQVVANMVHVGDRLGLYREMWNAGAVTSAQLADRTGLHERWLREWLRGQAAADLIDSVDGETFELTALQAEVLANEDDSLFFAAGAFGEPPDAAFMDLLVDAFRTGRGLPYDALGPGGADQTERMLGPFTRQMLVPVLVAEVDGLTERLESGIRVADVGCGGGLALSVLANAFPESTFVGIDPSRHAIDRAERKIAEQGLDNVEFSCADGQTITAHGQFDLVLTFDCLHDMPRPDLVTEAIASALAPDGTWLVKEIRCSGDFATDRKNPVLAMMYAGSVMTCMSSALSEPGGLGLGTLGLPPDRLREMAAAAGLTQFETHDIGDPANLYYVCSF